MAKVVQYVPNCIILVKKTIHQIARQCFKKIGQLQDKILFRCDYVTAVFFFCFFLWGGGGGGGWYALFEGHVFIFTVVVLPFQGSLEKIFDI